MVFQNYFIVLNGIFLFWDAVRKPLKITVAMLQQWLCTFSVCQLIWILNKCKNIFLSSKNAAKHLRNLTLSIRFMAFDFSWMDTKKRSWFTSLYVLSLGFHLAKWIKFAGFTSIKVGLWLLVLCYLGDFKSIWYNGKRSTWYDIHFTYLGTEFIASSACALHRSGWWNRWKRKMEKATPEQ